MKQQIERPLLVGSLRGPIRGGRGGWDEDVDELGAAVGLDPDLVEREHLGESPIGAGRGQFLGEVEQEQPHVAPGQALRPGQLGERAAERGDIGIPPPLGLVAPLQPSRSAGAVEPAAHGRRGR